MNSRYIQLLLLVMTLTAIAYWPETAAFPAYILGWNACRLDRIARGGET